MSAKKSIHLHIPDATQRKWQLVVDTLAMAMQVPVGLIMRQDKEFIEVLVSSKTEGNPYQVGEREHMHGLYCETVIRSQKILKIPNALKDKTWQKNPDIKLGMISYLGLPVNYPDKRPFGTLCVLDTKENHYSASQEKIMTLLKELIEADLALLYSNEQLRKLSSEKDLLISLLAHDLRTPMGQAYGFAELLTDSVDTLDRDKIIKYSTHILHSVNNSLKLMDDVLAWMHTMSENQTFHPALLPAAALLEELTTFYEELAAKKDLSFQVSADHDVMVYADKDMLKAILRNLLSNAIKYSYPGGTISLTAQNTPGGARLCVNDQGKGMNSETLHKILKSSDIYSSSGTAGEKGSGFGLLVCRHFVEMHDGHIHAKSIPEQGSQICFTLPHPAPA